MKEAEAAPRPDKGFETTLALLSRRWVMRIVVRLLEGPHRFSDLLRALRPLSANILTQRLGDLTEAGILRRRPLSTDIKAQVYELTDDGRRLETVVAAIADWSRTRAPDGGG